MRVLHIVSSPATSGVTSTMKLLILGLRERGHTAELAHYGREEGIAVELRRAGIPVHRIAAPALCFGPLRTHWILQQTERLVARLKPDIIHAHSFDADLIACRAVRGGNAVVVASVHSFSYLDWVRTHTGSYERYAGPLKKLITVSTPLGRQAARLQALSGKSFETVFDVPQKRFFDPVTTEERAVSRRNLGLAEGELAAVCVANFHQIKGQEILAQAFEILSRRRSDIRLILVGSAGDDAGNRAFRQQVEVVLAQARTSGRARIISDTTDPRPFLAAADVYVQPSHMEAFGVAIAEAMACGLPVVATDVGGIPELVTRSTGVLVPPADPRGMAEAIERLLADPGLRKILGDGGRDFASKSLTESCLLDAHERIYTQCLTGRGTQR